MFVHINFVAKRNGKKTLFFAEVEERGQGGNEMLEVRCCIPLESLCEGKPCMSVELCPYMRVGRT